MFFLINNVNFFNLETDEGFIKIHLAKSETDISSNVKELTEALDNNHISSEKESSTDAIAFTSIRELFQVM